MHAIEQALLIAIWVLLASYVGFYLSRSYRPLFFVFLLGACARIVIAVLQSGYGLFVSNADAVGYAGRGSLIQWEQSYRNVLDGVSSNQIGIIATNAWVATFHGPIPVIVMVSILGSLVSALAVELVLEPYVRAEPDSGHLSHRRNLLICVASLSPSFLFWGAQDLKEPFLMLGVALFTRSSLVGWPMKPLLAICGVLICIAFRPYIGALVLGVGVLFAVSRPFRRKAGRSTLLGLLCAALFVGISFGSMITGVDLQEQQKFSELAGGGSAVSGGGGPVGVSNVGEFFFAPLPWQAPNGALGLFVYVESLVIGILMLRYFYQLATGRRSIAGDTGMLTLLLYCTAAAVYAAGLANTGTLSRERSPFLLILLPLLLLPAEREEPVIEAHVTGAGRQLNSNSSRVQNGTHAGSRMRTARGP